MTHCSRCDPVRPTAHDPYGHRAVGMCDRCAEAEAHERLVDEWVEFYLAKPIAEFRAIAASCGHDDSKRSREDIARDLAIETIRLSNEANAEARAAYDRVRESRNETTDDNR